MKWPTILAATLLWGGSTSCVPKPPPYPEAPERTGLTLRASTESLLIRPAGAVQLRYTVTDGQGVPVPNLVVAFALTTEDQSDPPAQLSLYAGMTDADGGIDLQVIAKPLPTGVENAPAVLVAATEGADPAYADVLVSMNTFSARVMPRVDEQALGINKVVTVRLTPFDRVACADLDLVNLPRTSLPHRDVSLGSDVLIQGLTQARDYAIVAIGRDKNGTRRISGCVDLPGKRLQASEAVRISVFLDRVLPTIGGTYQLTSNFAFSPPLDAIAPVLAIWQQLSECPLDPARLMIDCTIDALSGATLADPIDCVPLAGKEGPLAASLIDHRGLPASTLAGEGPVEKCHEPKDAQGRPSLESLVNTLFANTQGQLQASELPSLPEEIQAMLASIQLTSTLVVSASDQPLVYYIDHSLQSILFPDAPRSSLVPLRALPAGSTTVSGLLGTHRAEQLSIPQHAFTLRLGSAANIAFQNSSLRNRGFPDYEQLVSTLYEWAEISNNAGLVRGCEAIDTVLCDAVALVHGCVFDACVRGMSSLSTNLRASFASLDGQGFDFTLLTGAVSVLDLDNDGVADSLGSITTPGRWTAEFRASNNASRQAQGDWTGIQLSPLSQ